MNAKSQFDLLIATDYPQCSTLGVESIWCTDRGQILIDPILKEQRACTIGTRSQLRKILGSAEMRFVEMILKEKLGHLQYVNETNAWIATDDIGKGFFINV